LLLSRTIRSAGWEDRIVAQPDQTIEAAPAPDVDQMRRSSMAAERTWLAWWRTALAATAGALAVGRFAPELLHVAAWPYVALGCCYAGLAIGLLVMGALRQRDLEASLHGDTHRPIGVGLVAVFTGGGILLALATIVLVVAQT
jgi:putative membrane protein